MRDSFVTGNGSYGGSIHVKYHTRISFSGGIAVNWELNTKFSISVKFLYESKGANGTATIAYSQQKAVLYEDIEVKINQRYLSLPVTARYTCGIGKEIKIAGEVGMFIGYLMKAKEIRPDVTITSTEPSTVDVSYRYNHVDVGLSFGISGGIPISKKFSFKTSLLDNVGVKNIGSDSYNSIRTNSLNLLFGICYSLK